MTYHQSGQTETTRDAISHCQLTASEHWNVSLRVYKTVKALTRLLAVGAGILSIHQGADPMTVFALIALIETGPEAIEYVWANGSNESDTDD